MILELAILDVLKRHSSEKDTGETRSLKCTEIVKYLQKEYPNEDITDKRVRNSLNKLINEEADLTDGEKNICYKVFKRRGKEDYRTDFWTPKNISDVELKYLIDSVMYSKIFDSAAAQDFAERIQKLSGKNLHRMTPYTSKDVFGEQRLTTDVDVLRNVQTILEADRRGAFISFDWHVYDVVEPKNGRIGLKWKDRPTVKPLQMVLNEGEYFLLARYPEKEKVYTFRLTLMTGLAVEAAVRDNVKVDGLGKSLNRARYILQHPYNMGGEAERFTIRVKRDYLTRVVDTFGYEIKVVPRSVTEETVDIRVQSSAEGIKRWLLFHYESVEVLSPNEKFAGELREAVECLREKYGGEG